MEITPRLALTFVDRLLGGPGHSVEVKDGLSEIETILFDQITKILLSEWCTQWNDLQELRPALLGHEIDARYLGTLPRTEVMFVLTMEMAIGDCRERTRLGLPYFTLEPLLAKLAAENKTAVSQVPTISAPKWNQIFANVQVPATAVFDALDLTTRQLASLKVGDTFPLEPSRFAQIRVRLGETAKFIATAGTSGPLWAVQLTQKL
jgi:flagellar motor switch protein FliM